MGNLFTPKIITGVDIPPRYRCKELTDEFIEKMPKIELHAHLYGSLNDNSISELSDYLYPENLAELEELTKNFDYFDRLNLNDCFQKFKIMHKLTSTRKGLKMATLLAIRDFAREGVIYLELRTTPKLTADMSKRDYLNCLLDAIKEARIRYPDILVKLLPSINRNRSVQDAEETLKEIMKLRHSNSNAIVGIDFSGNPNYGTFKQFIPVLKRAREFGLKLAIHCAETDNPKEIEEMLKFGMDRCGHGTFLSTTQIELLASRSVAIECCLTSNIKCGTVPTYKVHHLRRIYASNRATPVLCTDSSGVFDTTLTSEFIKASDKFGLTKGNVMDLCCNAADHAFAKQTERLFLKKLIFNYFTYYNPYSHT